MKVGNLSQPRWPPPLANLGILNCYFFIGYLGLIDHEMDFEMNLFFSLTKVVWHLEKCLIFLIYGNWRRWKFLSVRPTPPKNGKMFYVFIMCFRAFWAFFIFLRNLLRGWDPGRPPPCWDGFPTFTIFLKASRRALFLPQWGPTLHHTFKQVQTLNTLLFYIECFIIHIPLATINLI